jgi:hypothetical protein
MINTKAMSATQPYGPLDLGIPQGVATCPGERDGRRAKPIDFFRKDSKTAGTPPARSRTDSNLQRLFA